MTEPTIVSQYSVNIITPEEKFEKQGFFDRVLHGKKNKPKQHMDCVGVSDTGDLYRKTRDGSWEEITPSQHTVHDNGLIQNVYTGLIDVSGDGQVDDVTINSYDGAGSFSGRVTDKSEVRRVRHQADRGNRTHKPEKEAIWSEHMVDVNGDGQKDYILKGLKSYNRDVVYVDPGQIPQS